MTTPIHAPGGAYEGAGRQAALAVRGYSSVIVTADDIVAAAHTAIGIALAESSQRLVMVADLGDDTPPLQALVRDDDTHGVYDAFEFGTSFVRIAREVEGAKNFFVMPSGTEAASSERILSSPRWSNFASEFASADELLLLVAASNTPGLNKLAERVDGVVLVGIQRLESAPQANVLARIPHPVVAAAPRIDIATRQQASSLPLGKLGIAAAILLAVGIGAGALFGRHPAAAPVPVAANPVPDSAAAADSARARRPAVLPANPADSADATQFSVLIMAANTAEGATIEVQRHGSVMPAATISLVPIGDTEATWYKVHAGAYGDSAQAEQLLATLRRRQVVPDSSGSVVRAPFALLVDSIPPQAGMTSRVRERIDSLAAKQVIAYSLRQRDGSAKLYVGAFERPEESSLAATALRVAGLTPVLAYRTGRLR